MEDLKNKINDVGAVIALDLEKNRPFIAIIEGEKEEGDVDVIAVIMNFLEGTNTDMNRPHLIKKEVTFFSKVFEEVEVEKIHTEIFLKINLEKKNGITAEKDMVYYYPATENKKNVKEILVEKNILENFKVVVDIVLPLSIF